MNSNPKISLIPVGEDLVAFAQSHPATQEEVRAAKKSLADLEKPRKKRTKNFLFSILAFGD
jgi:hypothetical protein